jgi:SAM-dependent methyltransferase
LSFTSFVLSQVQPPPRRVLEVGCGSGELALALSAAGYEVVAVDPDAPAGTIFRRSTIEELDEPGLFDAIVAAFSLHHVSDLDVVLDKLRGLLDGVLIVDEFGWDLIDETTASQYDLDLDEWRVEHDGLHTFKELREGLEARFTERYFARGLYFSRHLEADEDEERKLIEAGKIVPLGFRFVGSSP